jgi:hypothetical protein
MRTILARREGVVWEDVSRDTVSSSDQGRAGLEEENNIKKTTQGEETRRERRHLVGYFVAREHQPARNAEWGHANKVH